MFTFRVGKCPFIVPLHLLRKKGQKSTLKLRFLYRMFTFRVRKCPFFTASFINTFLPFTFLLQAILPPFLGPVDSFFQFVCRNDGLNVTEHN